MLLTDHQKRYSNILYKKEFVDNETVNKYNNLPVADAPARY